MQQCLSELCDNEASVIIHGIKSCKECFNKIIKKKTFRELSDLKPGIILIAVSGTALSFVMMEMVIEFLKYKKGFELEILIPTTPKLISYFSKLNFKIHTFQNETANKFTYKEFKDYSFDLIQKIQVHQLIFEEDLNQSATNSIYDILNGNCLVFENSKFEDRCLIKHIKPFAKVSTKEIEKFLENYVGAEVNEFVILDRNEEDIVFRKTSSFILEMEGKNYSTCSNIINTLKKIN